MQNITHFRKTGSAHHDPVINAAPSGNQIPPLSRKAGDNPAKTVSEYEQGF